MKKLFVSIQTMLFILIIISCNGPQKNSDNQSVSAPVGGKSDTPILPDQAKPADGTQNVEGMTGSQIIEKTIKKLNNKLSLVDQQAASLKDVLSKTLLASGEDLNKTYTIEQSKSIDREIIQKSSDQIIGILDANQKEKFNTFLHQ